MDAKYVLRSVLLDVQFEEPLLGVCGSAVEGTGHAKFQPQAHLSSVDSGKR